MPRYTVYAEIGSGAAGTVHLARLEGAAGFSRVVAVKKMHRAMTSDPAVVRTFVDEARLAARIHHPNVVSTLDVIAEDGEVAIVMDYVEGTSLDRLLLRGALPPALAVSIVSGFLAGLQAAHEATDERGESLELVHRDVSPQNVIVGNDGIARLCDFGIAKATGRLHVTRTGVVKGKLAYMPPEQLYGEPLDARADVYAAGVVLWEALTGERLFAADSETETLSRILEAPVPAPSERNPALRAFDDVVLRALSRDAHRRFESARAFATALEAVMAPAPPSEVSAYVSPGAAPPPPRRTRVFIGVAAAAVTLGLALVAFERPHAPPLVTAPAPTAVVEPPPDPSAEEAKDESSPSPAPKSRPPRDRGRRKAVSAAPDCTLPYAIDADGRRHYKPECVRH